VSGHDTVVGVVTVVHGRHDHLHRQQESLRRSTRRADVRVVVAMDDPDLELDDAEVVHLPARADGRLPLAAARNAGVRAATDRGADVLVLLDVDCLVAPATVAAYDAAVREQPRTLWSGPVTYLRAADRPYRLDDLDRLDDPHPARPAPAQGHRETGEDWSLFWSLSFAVSADGWAAAGGFDEAYAGYGGEDTDFAQRARRAGLTLGWDGGARAYHQHHPTSSPPVQHLDDVLRNGEVFAERWGWWPMAGWLHDFERLGLVRRSGDGWVAA
jgi:N-acetylglucosaminyl-diphospho-decaprenol L-rhamnosyltransferase